MKKIIVLLLFLAVAFVSCDKRGSAREHLQNSISEFSKKQTLIETVTYFPEHYTEVKTDSLIAKTFKVRIKNYTLMDSNIVLDETHSKNERTVNYHRVFASDIQVSYRTKDVLNTTISAENFNNSADIAFWNTATLEHVWVNQDDSNQDRLNLRISFINPIHQSYKLYELVINTEGQQHINLIEEHS